MHRVPEENDRGGQPQRRHPPSNAGQCQPFTTEVLASLPLVAEWTGVREWIREANASRLRRRSWRHYPWSQSGLAYENGYGRPMPAVNDGGPGVTTPGHRVDWRTRMDTGGEAKANASRLRRRSWRHYPWSQSGLAYENGYGGAGQCQLVYNGGPGATTPGRRVDCRTRMDTGGEAKANASSFTTEVLASLPLVAEWTGVREWIRQANASSFTTEVLASLPLVSEWTGVREWIREVRQRPMPARLRRRSWRHYPWSQSGLAYENGYRR
ncbi:uncharacterized protein LOC144114757 isoform X4 [Amblyomma americanum]